MFTRRRLYHVLSIFVVVIMLFSGSTLPAVSAQGPDGIERQINAQTGKISFLGPAMGQTLPAGRALGNFFRPQDPAMALAKRFGPEFGLKNPERELSTIKSHRAEDGRITARYQQNYQGIPVMGGELVVNTNENGDLYSMNGETSSNLSLSTRSVINTEQSKEDALQAVAKWYQKSPEDFTASEPTLWVYDESLLRPSTRPAELVWRMDVTPKDASMPVRELVLVNAQRGGISLHFNQIDMAWHAAENPELNYAAATKNSGGNPVATLLGATWYVATTGNDSNSCSSVVSPCKTINGAISKAGDGDTIKVAAGVYAANDTSVTIVKSLTILGGWNSGFSNQTGFSTIEGNGTGYHLILFKKDSVAERLILRNGGSALAITDSNGGCPNQTTVTLRQSSIVDMSGSFTNCGKLFLVNSTISDNQGPNGAISNSGTLNIQNSTIANNAGRFAAGGINNSFGDSVTIQNSIIYGNTGSQGFASDCQGSITSVGYNMIGTTANCNITLQATDKVGADPKLGPLHASGYRPLVFGSQAIDAAISCPTVDQRGVARPQGNACDIGAYEYMTPGPVASLALISGSNQRTAPKLVFDAPLRVAALDNQGNLVPNVSITFTAPNNGASGIFANTGTNTTTIVTDANGVVTTPVFTANSSLGAYIVTASANGISSVNFNLENFALYVATTGDDSNSCLIASSPCATIQGAINKATMGDTLLIATGVYTSTEFTVVWVNKSLTLSGGWDTAFTSQNGLSTIDGQNTRLGVYVVSVNGVDFITVTLDRFMIKNGSGGDGGGVNNQYADLTITNSSVQNNSASSRGGGINNNILLTLENTTVSNNSAGNGGGIYNQSSSTNNLTVRNSTISNNSAFYGGGIYNDGIGALNNVTLSDNTAYYGGGLNNNSGVTTLQNSILARNMAMFSAPDCIGSVGSSGYNLLGNNTGCTFTATTGDKVGTSASPIDPRLTLLKNNGGLTSTHALLTGSPAIDSGNLATSGSGGNACLATDQRGVNRSIGTRCDIGAYEGSVPWTFSPLVSTYTAGNGSSLPGTFICNQGSPNCAAGDAHARAAHKYATGTYNLYALQHSRNSINNSGMVLVSTVHYKSNYDNAFWNGDQMVYGDAYGFPLADDVVAHELTHGVTQYESNLFYYYQSGAINESFSDLWGEYYDQSNGQGSDTQSDLWRMGEDVAVQGAIRDMSNPGAYADPDKMSSSNYYKSEDDNGGVHHNSGINNKAVTLMVMGGTFNGKTVSALGWSRTAAIYYEVNTKLLSSGADYSDLYYALQQACSNLIGQKGIAAADCVEVKDAIDAVEMNGQPATNFNTDAPVCAGASVPNIVFADNLETGTANWTFSNGAYTRWQLDTPIGPFAQSSLHSLYADDYPDVVTDTIARLKPLAIPANAYLHFAHAYGFESGYNPGDPTFYHFDGGVLEYSVNGGSSWVDAGSLMNFNGYTGVLFTGAGNPLSGRSAFAGDSHGYIGTRLDLASLAGKTVIFRWRMGLDEAGYDFGWWVDNIKLYTCTPMPGAFNKTAPANGAGSVSLNPTLSWNSSSAATSYQYCYDLINDNQCNRTWGSTSATSVNISNLGTNTTYYWQVRATNIAGTTHADSQSWGSFTTTSTLPAGLTGIETFIGINKQGKYSLGAGQSLRESYTGVNNGPVKIMSTNSTPLIGAERLIYKVNNVNTSFTEMMGLSSSQLDTTYWLPWYNNVDLDTQLRIANVSGATATVHILIGGQEMIGSPVSLVAGESTRLSFAGVNNGPVKIQSNVNIVAAERLIYKVNGVNTSFIEMMALPNSQLDTTYWLPWYNNADLDTQLRIANVSNSPAAVQVTIGGVAMPTLNLAAGGSTRVSYAGVNNGPVKIVSDQNIVAAERLIYKVNGVNTSFTEMMGLPANQLNTTYWLPWYNNVDLDTQLRFANTTNPTATVHILIGGVEMQGSPFTLQAGESTRQSFVGINNGPVQIVSDVPIVAAERLIYKINGKNTSFTEMMALPNSQLDTTYWLPWYNNVDLDTQLRFGVP